MNKNIKKLLADISVKCVKNGISFKLEYAPQVDVKNIPCSGYFDEESLVVAVKKRKTNDWLDILVHESCHLDQCLEKSKYWYKDEVTLDIVEGYLKGKNYSKTRLKTAFINTINLEMDCEKRTIRKMKKYNIKFNTSLYIQKANSYLFGYGIVYKTKVWPKTPYESPLIYKKMPKTFLNAENYLNIDDRIMKLYEKNNKTS